MTLQSLYLTIDDSPSPYLPEKVDFLKNANIPALIYARGEFIHQFPEQLIYAIQNGFLIGNHSYTHPFFSELSLETCIEEIQKTEIEIDRCYQKAGVPRPYKIMRFPFADRGAGKNAAIPSENSDQYFKVIALQKYLKDQGFQRVLFNHHPETNIDSYWDWDVQDYKSKYCTNIELYVEQLEEFYSTYKKDRAVIMLHDFAWNHDLFMPTMEFLLTHKCQFLPFCIR